jgi:hypothetical protein
MCQTIFQLYRGGQFYWWRKSWIEYTSVWGRFKLKTIAVIDTDCIGSCKSTTTTATSSEITLVQHPELYEFALIARCTLCKTIIYFYVTFFKNINNNLSPLLTELKEIIPRYMSLEMQVLPWDRHRNVAWL